MATPFMQKAREFLLGTPVQLADPAKIHISQVADEVYNSSTTNATANCGPASVIMALRLVGLPVPGEDRYRGEDLILHVRRMATRSTNRHVGTNNIHLQHVITEAGGRWKVLRGVEDILRAVRQQGTPVIMAGNPVAPGSYTDRFDYWDIRRWDSGHWIVVSRFDPEKRRYVVNDPQSTIGPVEVTADELRAFNSRDGDFGIQVMPG